MEGQDKHARARRRTEDGEDEDEDEMVYTKVRMEKTSRLEETPSPRRREKRGRGKLPPKGRRVPKQKVKVKHGKRVWKWTGRKRNPLPGGRGQEGARS